MAPAMCLVSADWPVTSGNAVALSNGSDTQVTRGHVLFFRIFVGDKAAAASWLQARPERACCCPSRRPRGLFGGIGPLQRRLSTCNNVEG